ncbi:hypothetical protein [Brasilonema sp. UFV-L1]|uniref:hypothetical protein n=1 Tax=Brasilonema sp. UFV-L1 TaxID=2234130 RepID=UPI00145F5094|nr:hypothetical protein [Brasilonema sp. UFV-L1]NMG05638.1 hypothetical protein [Brasilonema sp. UFV-L1]
MTWNSHKQKREVKAHSTELRTEQLKDGLSALDVQERQELGLTDKDNERTKALHRDGCQNLQDVSQRLDLSLLIRSFLPMM